MILEFNKPVKLNE